MPKQNTFNAKIGINLTVFIINNDITKKTTAIRKTINVKIINVKKTIKFKKLITIARKITLKKLIVPNTLTNINLSTAIKIVRKIATVITTKITEKKRKTLNKVKTNENKIRVTIVVKIPFISPIIPYVREIITITITVLA